MKYVQNLMMTKISKDKWAISLPIIGWFDEVASLALIVQKMSKSLQKWNVALTLSLTNGSLNMLNMNLSKHNNEFY